MRVGLRNLGAPSAFVFISALVACGGGGGSGTPNAQSAIATPSSTPAGFVARSIITIGASATSLPFPNNVGQFEGTITIPAAQSGIGSLITITSWSQAPSGVPALQAPVGPFFYLSLQSNATATFAQPVSFSFRGPGGDCSYTYAVYNSAIASAGYQGAASGPRSLLPGQTTVYGFYALYCGPPSPTPPAV